MKMFSNWTTAFVFVATFDAFLKASCTIDKAAIIQSIIEHAAADSIGFHSIPGLDMNLVLHSIATTYTETPASPPTQHNATNIVDAHAHIVPSWYRALVPTTGGNPTPSWNISLHLSFMSSQHISHSVFAFSSPGANVYPGNRLATVALARLMNEQSAAYARAYASKLSWYAVVPLPWTKEAVKEAEYALDTLGAAGIALFSNFEGLYLGSPSFTPFFSAMNERTGRQILYIHPTTPYLRLNNSSTLIEANPTIYPTGNIEFYFETARVLSDLAITQTLLNFTNFNYIVPHVGGAFPSVADRLLKSYPAAYNGTMEVLRTRVFWDSAGPTFEHQIGGLLAYDIPARQLLFGTDFPYAPGFTYGPSLLGVENSKWVTDEEREGIFRGNARRLFGDRFLK